MKQNIYKYCFLFLLLFANICYPQTFSKIKIYNVSNEMIRTLAHSGLPLEESHFNSVDNSIEIIVSDKEIERIKQNGLAFQTIIPDMAVWFQQRTMESNAHFYKQATDLPDGFKYGSLSGYPSMKEYLRLLDTLSIMYPGFVKPKESIGKTYEGRDIYLIRVSNYSSVAQKEKVLLTGLHHAREAASITTPLYYIFYILENYGKDPTAVFLLDHREFYLIPMVNPDGYAFNEKTNPFGGGMWRKNRTPYDNDYGVDLNRNYAFMWGYDDFGSSAYTSYETYRGPKPFSEAETQAIKNLCKSNNFITAINYHTFGNEILYPWSYANIETGDSLRFRHISKEISKRSSYVYGNPAGILGYYVNGDSDDWLYGDISEKGKIFAISIELGGGDDYFWAPIEKIKPIAEENIFSNSYAGLIAGAYIDSVKTPKFSKAGLGDTVSNVFNFFNHGLKAASYGEAELIIQDQYLESADLKKNTGLIDSYKESDSVTFKLTFKKTTPIGYVCHYKIKLAYDGYPFEKDFTILRSANEPVEYASIELLQSNQKIVLSWSTLTEVVHDGFTVEQKLNNGEFMEIGLVKSKGASGFSYSYNIFPNESGAYSFRLKTYSGKQAKYSEEKSINYKFTPLRYYLAQNFPNPANPETVIEFSLPIPSNIELSLYNILGEKVKNIVSGYYEAGKHKVTLNAAELASQIYFYELKTAGFQQIKRMLILK